MYSYEKNGVMVDEGKIRLAAKATLTSPDVAERICDLPPSALRLLSSFLHEPLEFQLLHIFSVKWYSDRTVYL